MGDLLVSLPAMEWLRADYTEVWTARDNVPLVRFADRVEAISSTGLDLLELGLSSAARLAGFDSIVSWYGSTREEFRDAVQGLPFVFHTPLPVDDSMHAVDFYLAQVGAPLGAVPRVPVERHQGNYVAIHPFSGSAKKNWPLERFREVTARLGAEVEWCVGPEESFPGARRFDDRLQLAQWLAGARCYLGNDSGVSHLAAAVGTPVVAIFGPTNPAVWAPRGDRVQVLVKPDVERTTRAVLDFIDAEPPHEIGG